MLLIPKADEDVLPMLVCGWGLLYLMVIGFWHLFVKKVRLFGL